MLHLHHVVSEVALGGSAVNTHNFSDTRDPGQRRPGRPPLPADQKSKKESIYLRPDVRKELEEKFPGLPVSQQVNLYILSERQKSEKNDSESD